MKQQRLSELEQLIYQEGSISIEELSNYFQVSRNTIRRDIDFLEQSGTIKKVHGGVISNKTELLTPFDVRTEKFISEKEKIASRAASFIQNGDFVFIDAGTTTRHILKYVPDHLQFTILTNSFDVITEATAHPNIDFFIIGNRYHSRSRSFINVGSYQNSIETFNISKAFMAATAVSIEKGLSNYEFDEIKIKKTVVQSADQLFLLVDNSKFNKTSLISFADLSEISVLITNDTLPDEYQTFCKKHKIEVYTN